MRRVLFLMFPVLIFSLTRMYAQSSPEVSLQWKLLPDEVLTYRVSMDQIDPDNYKPMTLNFRELFGGIADTIESSHESAGERLKLEFPRLNISSITAMLTEHTHGVVDIEISIDQQHEEESAEDNESEVVDGINNFQKIFMKMMRGVILRGAVYATGGVQSFYVQTQQKNMIAVLFELPQKKVKIGDTWSLNVNAISMDQNFRCDTSYRRNEVTLIDLQEHNGERVAVLHYDIEEYISGHLALTSIAKKDDEEGKDNNSPTTMRVTYNGLAEFSVDKGRWISYDGIMSIISSGFMEQNSSQRFALIPMH